MCEKRRPMAAIPSDLLATAVNAHAAVVVTDGFGVIMEVNDMFLRQSGFSREQLIGETHKVVKSDQHRPLFWRHFWQTLEAGKAWKGLICNRRKSGELYWVDTTVTVNNATTIKGRRFVAVYTDVTGIMSGSQGRDTGKISMLETVAKIGSWEITVEDRKLSWSPMMHVIHEVDAAFMPNVEDALGFINPDGDRDRIESLMERSMREGCSWEEEVRLVTARGREVWLRIVTEVEVVDGRCNRLIGTYQDIDRCKRAELEVANKSNQIYDALGAATGVCFLATDMNGLITVFSKGFEQLLGYSSADIVGRHTPALFQVPEELSHTAQELDQPTEDFGTFAALATRHGPETREWTFVRKDGSSFPASFTVAPVNDSCGKITGYVCIALDVSDKKQANRALMERQTQLEMARERMALAAKAGGVGIWDFNLVDGALAWDEQMFELYDVATDEFTAGLSDFEGSLHPDDKDRVMEAVRMAIEGEKPYNTEFRIIQRKSREVRHLRGMAKVLYDDDGKPLRMVGTNWDVTKQVQQRHRLVHLAEVARQASDAKTSFLANVSHEMRTPLNGILGMASLLVESRCLPQEEHSSMEIILKSSKTLLSVINDVLDFSKVEAGQLELENVEFDLRETLHTLGCLMLVKAEEKHLQFTCTADSKLPSFLVGDPERLHQVLLNLTGNAIKFTETGSVEVEAEVESRTEDEAAVTFRVTDTGVGVAQSEQQNIFERFTQADPSVTRKFGGTGLGLAISKYLVELMGGKLDMESTEGEGSSFWFTVSFKVRPFEKPASATLSGRHILVASPSEKLVLDLTEMLSSWGAVVLKASDGDEARVCLGHEHAPDVAIIDTEVPGIDLIEFAQSIRVDERLHRIPLVVLFPLGRKRPGDVERLCDAVHFRPPNPSKLFNSLARVFDDGKAAPQLKKERPAKLLVDASTRILLVEDNTINQLVVQRMLKQLNLSAQVASNGLEALERLNANRYDLVLMDVQMPEMDGLEATRRIRAHTNKNLAAIPIIAMTAHARAEDREECLRAGVNEYVTKPITFERLVDVITRFSTKAND